MNLQFSGKQILSIIHSGWWLNLHFGRWKKPILDAQSTMFQVVVDDDLHNVPIAHI